MPRSSQPTNADSSTAGRETFEHSECFPETANPHGDSCPLDTQDSNSEEEIDVVSPWSRPRMLVSSHYSMHGTVLDIAPTIQPADSTAGDRTIEAEIEWRRHFQGTIAENALIKSTCELAANSVRSDEERMALSCAVDKVLASGYNAQLKRASDFIPNQRWSGPAPMILFVRAAPNEPSGWLWAAKVYSAEGGDVTLCRRGQNYWEDLHGYMVEFDRDSQAASDHADAAGSEEEVRSKGLEYCRKLASTHNENRRRLFTLFVSERQDPDTPDTKNPEQSSWDTDLDHFVHLDDEEPAA